MNFCQCKETLGLVDVWRTVNKVKREYTFYSYNHTTHSRINYIFTSEWLSHSIDSPQIGLRMVSGHATVSEIWTGNLDVPRTWLCRLNNFVLECPGLEKYVEAETLTFFDINEGFTQVSVVWDTFKAFIRGILISFKATRDKQWNLTRKTLRR